MIENSKILIVDDDTEVANILSIFLKSNGCGVFIANSGREALEFLNNSNEIQIVMLDVQLPDINGITFIDTIKIYNPTVAVVVMTGHYSLNYVVGAMKKGASDFLVKPFEFDKMLFVLIRALKERSLLIEKQKIDQSLEDKKKILLLNTELQKKIDELTTMYHISNQFNSLTIFNDVYEKILNIVCSALDVVSCGYYIYDEKNRELILYKEKNSENRQILKNRIKASNEFSECLRSNKYYVYKNNKLYFAITIKGECIGFILVEGNKAYSKSNECLPEKDLFFLKLISDKASAQIENKMLYESLFNNVFQTLTSLITTINKRDSYTESHCKRVAEYSLLLADKMNLNDYRKNTIKFVAPVHDLGKIGVPDSILLKPDGLLDEEYLMMKNHSIFGEEIVNRFDILSKEAKIIRNHHERYDGKGYPDRLSKDEIPICSRVIAICDTFDAMTTNRPYRKAVDKMNALNEIKKGKGNQFDPDMTECFIEMVNDGICG